MVNKDVYRVVARVKKTRRQKKDGRGSEGTEAYSKVQPSGLQGRSPGTGSLLAKSTRS